MELFRALGALCERPGPELEAVARALELPGVPGETEFTDLFGFQLYPYASVYVGAEGMLGGEARDRVAGFWRALHLPVPAEPDHLAALLGLYAALSESERAEADAARALLVRESRRALLWEHLLSWLPPYLAKAHELAAPPYRCWAELLRDALAAEAGALGRAGALPAHLREAPPFRLSAETDSAALLDGLLAPVRTGMILTRDDLVRCARELGLGVRVAERRYSLRSLIEQDPAGSLGWLAAEAERWAENHAADAELSGEIARFWQDRANAAAAALAAAGRAVRSAELPR